MKNNSKEGFLGCVGNVDSIDIVLKYKPRCLYNRELFFIQKKKYTLDLCAVCDSGIQFIYILVS